MSAQTKKIIFNTLGVIGAVAGIGLFIWGTIMTFGGLAAAAGVGMGVAAAFGAIGASGLGAGLMLGGLATAVGAIGAAVVGHRMVGLNAEMKHIGKKSNPDSKSTVAQLAENAGIMPQLNHFSEEAAKSALDGPVVQVNNKSGESLILKREDNEKTPSENSPSLPHP